MKKFNSVSEYSVGLDIGTGSVGWCVTDCEGNLLSFRNKNMWGSRLFESADTAKDRREKRSIRRRYDRRRNRIRILQELFAPLINKVDENFYNRLEESFLFKEDKKYKSDNILFEDANYTDKEYYRDFKTIYHLRSKLIKEDVQFDIRMIYLAIHHIIKYRGNFLYEGQKFNIGEMKIDDTIKNIFNYVEDTLDETAVISDTDIKDITKILLRNDFTSTQKKEGINNIIKKNIKEKNVGIELSKAMVGQVFDCAKLFMDESIVDQEDKALKISFMNGKYEDELDNIINSLGEKFDLVENLHAVYSWMKLKLLLGNGDISYISDAMVKKYEEHHKDLDILKKLYRKYADEINVTYSEMFREEYKDGKVVVNYVNYIKHNNKSDKESLYKKIKQDLKNVKNINNDEDYQYIITKMDNDSFLLKQNSRDNSLIPYQMNEVELELIIEKQGKFYPELLEMKDKLLGTKDKMGLLTFRIPYYVGPLISNSNFSWLSRKEDKIYPWNFEEVIDIDKSAEVFIEKMTNYCTYLPNEKVLPKKSIYVQYFEVLNELNKIRVNDKIIPVRDKKRIINDLFMKYKTVKEKHLLHWLNINNFGNGIHGEYRIQGYQKDKEFASSLDACIDMYNIMGEINKDNIDMIENIIYWLTVFEDKKIVIRKIKSEYPGFGEKQINQLCKLNYNGWSRLSKKLLCEKTEGLGNKKESLLEILERTQKNFMQIINSKNYGLKKLIEDNKIKLSNNKITYEEIKNLQGSPAIKRGIWQTVKVVEEIKKIMGRDPKYIFIEFAREDQDTQRYNSRVDELKKKYEILKKEWNKYDIEVEKELKKVKKIDTEKLYLYYIQNGKCMYSMEPLDIDKLDEYQVDHILPQSLIPDNSIENKVLVKTLENQYKADNLVISSDVQNRCGSYWQKLHSAGLIGAKKLYNLQRKNFDENDIAGFINRQLVETRQIIKHVANLLEQYFVNSKVVSVKAQLTSDLRRRLDLIKCRNVNDVHHAQDAYIANILGQFILDEFSNLENDFIYSKYRKNMYSLSEQRKNKYGFVVGSFARNEENVSKLVKTLTYKKYCVTKKVEELTGAFYKETILSRNCGKNSLIPIKEGLDTKKYGGYTNENIAYSMIIEYEKKGKKVKELIGIPVLVARQIKNNDITIEKYLERNYRKPRVLRRKVMKYQLVEYKGALIQLASTGEIHNALQFILDNRDLQVLFNKKNSYKEEELDRIYNLIIDKIRNMYTLYESIIDKIVLSNKYEGLNIEDKRIFILEILKLTRMNAEYPNLAKFGLSDRMGRKSNITLDISQAYFIEQSITGLFEKRIKY